MPPSVWLTPVAIPTPRAVRPTAAQPPRARQEIPSAATAVVVFIVALDGSSSVPERSRRACRPWGSTTCGRLCELRHNTRKASFVGIRRRLDRGLPHWVNWPKRGASGGLHLPKEVGEALAHGQGFLAVSQA